jgi:hypothetical protein
LLDNTAKRPKIGQLSLFCATRNGNRYFKTVKGILKSGTGQVLTAAFLVVVVACSKGEEKPAPGILSHAQMVEVMKEIYLTEEKVNRLTLPRDSAEQIFDLMETRAFEKTGVDDSLFRVSVHYYVAHPKQLEKIYAALIDSLQLEEQKASAGTPPQ